MTTHTHTPTLRTYIHIYKRWKSTNWPYAFPKGPSQVTECKSSGGREKQMKEKPNPSLHRRVVVGKCFSFSFFSTSLISFLFCKCVCVCVTLQSRWEDRFFDEYKKKCEENFRSVNAIVITFPRAVWQNRVSAITIQNTDLAYIHAHVLRPEIQAYMV